MTKSEAAILRNTTHGMSTRREYPRWKDMKRRCFNPSNKRYKDYAERGISVHPDFVKDFPKFLAEVGDMPEGDGWSLGRIDNNGWYTYGNIRWERAEQQARNHSRQRNNSSGITGIKVRTRAIGAGFYTSVTACWTGLDGKRGTKDFSADKHGLEAAVSMAKSYRQSKINEMNAAGAEYAESHGSAK